jgi:orotidine-5'-phosphate decarboxylase
MGFREKLSTAMARNQSLLCVGLDPQPELMPVKDVARFNRAIIEATQDLVCAYKPNLAFYEAMGRAGLRALEKTLSFIPPHIPTIGDAKRGDVGHSARAYARALFDGLGFDAVTLSPYLGYDSVEPFLSYPGKAVFLLCRTSNPGGADLQGLTVSLPGRGELPLYQAVALRAVEWDRGGNVGLVVGATYPEELHQVRRLSPTLSILVPGIGPQGGDLELSVRYGLDPQGTGLILTASRAIIYASQGRDFPQQARLAAANLRDQINSLRPHPTPP